MKRPKRAAPRALSQSDTKRGNRSRAGRASAPVLALGSGLHNAANTGGLNWPELLASVFPDPRVEAGGDEVVALAWEARLVDGTVKARSHIPAVAETRALKRLACKLDTRYPASVTSPIHERLRAGGFADLLVFNFDRSLHGDFDSRAWSATVDARRGPELHNTRVWYPHGHTGSPKDIVFGTRRYGTEIRRLEAARGRYWKAQREPGAGAHFEPAPTHWLHTLLARRDLHLIGLGLRPEEWTLWWALTQRARRFARHEVKPKTTAHILWNRLRPAAHASWRSSALAALGIEEHRFGVRKSESVWREVLDACDSREKGRSQR